MEQIEFDYKKLRVAQDLNKQTLGKVGMLLLRKGANGTFIMPPDVEIAAYINTLAEDGLIRHYVLQGIHEKVYLFNNDDVIAYLSISKVEARKVTEVVKVQCYDTKVTPSDDVPLEISAIDGLYKIPETLFNSGTCVYFLCRDGVVVYVGQSQNIHNRLMEHRTTKKFDHVYYIRVAGNKLNRVENALIAHLKPEYNKTSLHMTNQKQTVIDSILK